MINAHEIAVQWLVQYCGITFSLVWTIKSHIYNIILLVSVIRALQ